MANKDMNEGSEQDKTERSASDSAARKVLSEPPYAGQDGPDTTSNPENRYRIRPSLSVEAAETDLQSPSLTYPWSALVPLQEAPLFPPFTGRAAIPEALRKVAKHAGKTHVKLVLSGKDGSLHLRVMGFGVGFGREADNPNHGLGMISMQERARLAGGTLTVQSELGQGTTVIADVPVVCHA